MSWHYFEAHVTIDPVEGERLNMLEITCTRHGFRVADLVMLRSGLKHDGDTFCTGRDAELSSLLDRLVMLLRELKECGFRIRRHKVEHTLFDSRHDDCLFRLSDGS